jgi:hypothetical protein
MTKEDGEEASSKYSLFAAYLVRSSTMSMNAVRYSETSVKFYHITRRRNPEDSSLQITNKLISLGLFCCFPVAIFCKGSNIPVATFRQSSASIS